MLEKENIFGVLLAGGLSRRMFAGEETRGDKGLLEIAGRPMIAHVIDRLAPQVGALAINANGDPSRLSALHLPVFPDTIDGHPGPLAGVLAGMHYAHTHAPAATHILTAPTDAPLLPSNLAQRLANALADTGQQIALAKSAGNRHPVIGLWPVSLTGDLEDALISGVRKVLQWTDSHGTCFADFPMIETAAAPVDPFFNANTPQDLDNVRAILERM